jgi:hypothetical protein
LLVSGVRVVLPEIADYEVRRELLRAGKAAGVARVTRRGLPARPAQPRLNLAAQLLIVAASFP